MKTTNKQITSGLMLCLFLFWASPSTGEPGPLQQPGIKISGTVDQRLDARELIITLATDVFQTINWPFDAEQISVPIANGAFSTTFEVPGRFCYAKFQLLGEEGTTINNPLLPYVANFFLLETGHDVQLKISADQCDISGSGAKLFRCQHEANLMRTEISKKNNVALRQVEEVMKKSRVENKDIGAMKAHLVVRFEHEYQIRDAQIAALHNYCNHISKDAMEILEVDYRMRALHAVLRQMHFFIKSSVFATVPGAQRDILQLFMDSVWFSASESVSDKVIPLSKFYLPTLYLKELSTFSLPIKANQSAFDSGALFEAVVRKIAATYKGALAEQLLTTAFVTQMANGNISDELYDYALGLLHNPAYRQWLVNLSNTSKIGSVGFGFTLQDSTGKWVSFSGFKGKVVILDFWYTGCGGCIGLKKKMGPVFEKFLNTDNVSFVTVSIDKNQSTWKKSLQSGIYTHDGSINLYTGGKGKDAPVINHYRIGAYPTVIIFDQEGMIRSYNPPEIGSEIGNNRLIALIDSLI
ncbi:TlpA family protein disulfide reductase [Parapedobacter sp. 2B3]|uniref:TlpA family protein disulfide reductase n=1 Tax=Parapedobacter sp. 2B3 TaxID=3342381 RepID=UPI0035B64318